MIDKAWDLYSKLIDEHVADINYLDNFIKEHNTVEPLAWTEDRKYIILDKDLFSDYFKNVQDEAKALELAEQLFWRTYYVLTLIGFGWTLAGYLEKKAKAKDPEGCANCASYVCPVIYTRNRFDRIYITTLRDVTAENLYHAEPHNWHSQNKVSLLVAETVMLEYDMNHGNPLSYLRDPNIKAHVLYNCKYEQGIRGTVDKIDNLAKDLKERINWYI